MNELRPLVSGDRRMTQWALLLTLLGLALRIAGAQGDLWLDEIHSILLSESVQRADEVFWQINHDNNHFLNTLYLFLIGPDHSPVVLRLEAIVFGTLSIPAAGLAAYGYRRRDATAAVAAMLLTAIVYPSVHYGSEARGYAGLVLFSFLAMHIVEGGLKTRRDQVLLGIVTLLGVLSHLFMVFPLAGFILLHGTLIRSPKEDWFGVMARAAVPFWAAIIAVLVPLLCILIGTTHHGLQHGSVRYPNPHIDMLLAIGLFFDWLFGFQGDWLPIEGFTGLLLCGLAMSRSSISVVRRRVGYLLLLAVIYFSFLMLYGATHDINAPRYIMPLLAPAIILLADCVSAGLKSRTIIRWVTICLFACLCAGTCGNLIRFYADGRGHYDDAVLTMTRNGLTTYTSDVIYGHSQLVDFYSSQLGRRTVFIPYGDVCVIKPEWLLHTDEAERSERIPPDEVRFGPDGCKVDYDKPQRFGYWGMSGWNWWLYHKADDK